MRIKINIYLLFFLFVVIHTFAQEKKISGLVSNQQGVPLVGVSVSLKGNPAVNVLTGTDGRYTMNVKEGDILVFSFLEMRTLERTVGQSSTLDVVMEQQTTTTQPATSKGVARTNV